MAPTQRDMALEAAAEHFKKSIALIFSVLDENLITAPDAADTQSAIDRAKKGLATCQSTYARCRELALTLPATPDAGFAAPRKHPHEAAR